MYPKPVELYCNVHVHAVCNGVNIATNLKTIELSFAFFPFRVTAFVSRFCLL